MNSIRKTILLSLAFLTPLLAFSVEIGDTRDSVVSEKGEADGALKAGRREFLNYPSGRIVLVDGVVVSIEGTEASRPTIQNAKGALIQKKSTAYVHAPDVINIKKGGARIDLKSLMVPGKITIIDFYADWCGPCRKLSPHLEKIAKNNPDVILRKVDIVDWGTAVVKQYNIRSVPNVWILNDKGEQSGSATSRYNAILENIEDARSSM